jgi:circadian clock protein KaiC
MHLATMYKEIETFRPSVVILDPMTSLLVAGSESETKSMVTRLIDYLKSQEITSLFTSLTHAGNPLQQSEITISSLMDSWLLLQDIEGNGERNRVLYVLKARGMAHSNQSREFVISNRGIDLVDAYIGPGGVLTGAARAAQDAHDKAEALAGQQEVARGERELERKRVALEGRIAAQRFDYEAEKEELRRLHEQVATRTRVVTADRTELAFLRHADAKKPVSARPNPTVNKKRSR